MKILIPVLIIFLITISGCFYDSEEYLYPQLTSGCDTTNITYTGSIKPILNLSCLSCHSNSTAASYGANIKLEDYSDVNIRVNDGKLMGTITHSSGYSAMPKGSSKLSDCSIALIQKWISKGAVNN